MTDEKNSATDTAAREDWSVPRPHRLPKPTYWPAVAALGVTFIFFGVVTSWAFTVAGGALFALALAKWIGEMLDGE